MYLHLSQAASIAFPTRTAPPERVQCPSLSASRVSRVSSAGRSPLTVRARVRPEASLGSAVRNAPKAIDGVRELIFVMPPEPHARRWVGLSVGRRVVGHAGGREGRGGEHLALRELKRHESSARQKEVAKKSVECKRKHLLGRRLASLRPLGATQTGSSHPPGFASLARRACLLPHPLSRLINFSPPTLPRHVPLSTAPLVLTGRLGRSRGRRRSTTINLLSHHALHTSN